MISANIATRSPVIDEQVTFVRCRPARNGLLTAPAASSVPFRVPLAIGSTAVPEMVPSICPMEASVISRTLGTPTWAVPPPETWIVPVTLVPSDTTVTVPLAVWLPPPSEGTLPVTCSVVVMVAVMGPVYVPAGTAVPPDPQDLQKSFSDSPCTLPGIARGVA